jgi:hypothetical protein
VTKTQTTPAPDLASLEAQAQEAAQRFKAAEDALARVREQERLAREERARQIDERIVADYNEQEHFRAVRHARQELDRALADSPVGRAWVAVQVAETLHAHAAEDRNGSAARLGLPDRVASHPASNAVAKDLARAIDRVASGLVADHLDARDAAREAAINGK